MRSRGAAKASGANSHLKAASAARADGRGLRVALVHSAFNPKVVGGLVDGARSCLADLGVRNITECEVPGAFELPLACKVAAESGRFDAVVALGAVIQGGTDHYEHVATAATSGLLHAGLLSGVPVAFGVLTVRRAAQALARSAPGSHNKGAEAAAAVVAQVRALELLGASPRRPRRATGSLGKRR